jgi:hypothetical protein
MSKSFALDFSSSLRLELSVTSSICRTIDTPRALTVFLMIKHQEFDQLVDLDIDPSRYEDPQHFADDYLVTNLLSKSTNLPLDVDRDKKALGSFWESEIRCCSVNEKLLSIPDYDLPKVVRDAKAIIKSTLGPLRRRDLNYVEEHFRFGPGATTGVRGSGSVLSDKYDEEIHLTYELIPFYRAMLGDNWWSYKTKPVVVEGNKFTTVPKNAKTNRGICIEPTLNIYGQLGVGALLRKRLLHSGIDLTTQKRNQHLAEKAYALELATIDLSAASDSVAWGLVLRLFPDDWFELLDVFRSTHTNLNGLSVELEKFSSMGNGYTFELETLIFASIAKACVPLDEQHLISVYGDDIILPQAYAGAAIDALNFLGFRVNERKSFLAGNFFESCGTDWFKGQNVRPFFLRQGQGSKIPYSVQIANALRIYASRRLGGLACDSRFQDLWIALYKGSPRSWRKCRVPLEFGDSGFITSESEAKAPRAQFGLEGRMALHMTLKPVRRRKRTYGRLLAALACPVPDIFTTGYEPKRGFLREPVPKKAIVSRWSPGFEWC